MLTNIVFYINLFARLSTRCTAWSYDNKWLSMCPPGYGDTSDTYGIVFAWSYYPFVCTDLSVPALECPAGQTQSIACTQLLLIDNGTNIISVPYVDTGDQNKTGSTGAIDWQFLLKRVTQDNVVIPYITLSVTEMSGGNFKVAIQCNSDTIRLVSFSDLMLFPGKQFKFNLVCSYDKLAFRWVT